MSGIRLDVVVPIFGRVESSHETVRQTILDQLVHGDKKLCLCPCLHALRRIVLAALKCLYIRLVTRGMDALGLESDEVIADLCESNVLADCY